MFDLLGIFSMSTLGTLAGLWLFSTICDVAEAFSKKEEGEIFYHGEHEMPPEVKELVDNFTSEGYDVHIKEVDMANKRAKSRAKKQD